MYDPTHAIYDLSEKIDDTIKCLTQEGKGMPDKLCICGVRCIGQCKCNVQCVCGRYCAKTCSYYNSEIGSCGGVCICGLECLGQCKCVCGLYCMIKK